MSVIAPSCTVPTETSPGCGCAAKTTAGQKVATAAITTALAAAACTACCVLPFALPVAVLALSGGSIAILDHAHGWMTRLAIGVVICAWSWITWQRKRRGRRITGLALALMIVATVLTATAASWPRLESLTFHALGIVKKNTPRPNE
jgi:cytochrome bd-type quinol oxidase subunit 2